jgi:glycosyltransferase involved in cell wall biosynthesis
VKIGIDAYSLKGRSGIGRYTRELVRALAIEAPAAGHAVTIVHPEGKPWAAGACVTSVTGGPRSRAAWELFGRARVLGTGKFDVFHGPDFCLPRGAWGAGVVTMHDVAFIERPDLVSPRARLLYGALAPRAARRARLIICMSEHAKARISARLGVAPDRLRVVPCGVAECFSPSDAPEAAAARVPCRNFLRGRRYVLGVGTIQARKNFTALARAIARVRLGGEDLALVIAGADVPGAAAIRAEIRTVLGPDAAWFGAPTDDALADLYRAATAVAVVSTYEGFGIPVIEALACGAPVLVADRGPLVEVSGGAAVIARSTDADAISEALLALLRAPARERFERRRRGLERAAALSWRAVARWTIAVYDEAAEGC